jgi:hypothetical protein
MLSRDNGDSLYCSLDTTSHGKESKMVLVNMEYH